ncbi:MAG: AEC family transporter [Pseudomonadota bacterium]
MALILNSVLPIFVLILLGWGLKRFGLTDDRFLRNSDRLIYYIFFPALLFWKIGAPSAAIQVPPAFVLAVLAAVFTTFAACLVFAELTGMDRRLIGSFAQISFRFSTYIGVAVLLNALGEDGVRRFGLLIGFVIPFINVLCVGTLIWYSDAVYAGRDKAVLIGKALVSNPLIIACVLGVIYSRLNIHFPRFVDNTLGLMSMLTLPMALISIGGALSFRGLTGPMVGPALAGNVFKLAFMPLVGYLVLCFFGITGPAFQVAMIFFALPTSPQTFILSAQLDSDLDLAAAGIMSSTLLSIVSVSVVLVLFIR